ncbi:MAG TPA: hypothetical protein VFO84_01485 [Dehalococcoidia bacterium]|nr:hypothetical protein [Dehalococcoidia bacterium]
MKALPCLLVSLAILLAACGDDDDQAAEATEPPSGATDVEEPASPEETADEEPGAGNGQVIDGEARGLYLYSPDNGELEQVADRNALGERGVGLDWFPDGESLAAFGADLVRVEVGGDSHFIYEPEDLTFGTAVSPDGERIAFSCSGPASADVCIVAADGPQLTRASEDEYFDYLLNWLDDERILILSDSRPGAPDIPVYEGHFPQLGGYFVLNTADGNIVPATPADVADPWLSLEGEWTFSVSPEPPHAVFSDGGGGSIEIPIESEDLAGIDPTALPDQFQVAWSNGDTYAALVQRVVFDDGSFIRSAYNVWLVDLNAATAELVVQTEPCLTDLDCLVTVDWSPDSGSLAILFGIAGD